MREMIEHATGEVVIVRHANFLENPDASCKFRPGVILVPTKSCHVVVPLTSKSNFKGCGKPRRACPAGPQTGLRPTSYFWSRRSCRISRIDIRHHVGWADEEMVDAIIAYMNLDSGAVQALLDYRSSIAELFLTQEVS